MERKNRAPDIWLFVITVALLSIGVVMVMDASYARAGQAQFTGGDSYYYVKRQALFAAVGLLAMFVMQRVRFWRLKPFASGLLIISFVGLVAVLIPSIGHMANGARRWIVVGPVSFQPAEFAKLALALYLATLLTSRKYDIRDLWSGIAPALLPLCVIAALIMLEPDMGTAIVTCATALVLIYVAGARPRHLAAILTAGFVAGVALIIKEPYRWERVEAWFNPFAYYHGSGYQVCRSLIAIGSGGPIGLGFCDGREKVFYLPAEHTDFIFAVLGEEAGLLGTLIVAGLFMLFAVRGFRIARRTKDKFGKFLAVGITGLIAGQALLNMYVVTSLAPATGVPLPFISYGGSSLVLNLMCVGILLGISQFPNGVDDEDSPYRRRNRRPRLSRG